jgi:hypothetical protein
MLGVSLLIVLCGYFGGHRLVALLKAWRDFWLILRFFPYAFCLNAIIEGSLVIIQLILWIS